MAKTFLEMKTRAIALAGRTGDTTLMTATLVGDYINKAQLELAKSFPRLRDLRVLDKTTWDFVEDQYEYNLALAQIKTSVSLAFDLAGGSTYVTSEVSVAGAAAKTDIAFVDGGDSADTITSVGTDFTLANGFEETGAITVSGSEDNDGTYQVTTRADGTLTLATGILTGETAGETVTIKPHYFTLNAGDIVDAVSGTNITVGYYPVLKKNSTGDVIQVVCGDDVGDASNLVLSWGGQVLTVLNAWYIDTTNNQQQLIKPFPGSPKTWDEDIVPRLQKTGRGLPTRFFQRGSMLELNWPAGTNEAGKDLWIEYCRRPAVMSGDTDTSQISDIDEELVGWAMGLTFLYVPLLNMLQEGAGLIQAARAQISERVLGENRRPMSTMNPYQGP